MDQGALVGFLLLTKLGLGASALIAIGSAMHCAMGIIAKPRGILRVAALGAAAALLFGIIRMLLVSAELAGGLPQAFEPQALAWAWSTHAVNLFALAAGLSACTAALWLRPRLLAGLGAVAIAASFAVLGHTQALEAPGAAPALLGLHVLIAGFWFAAPLSLWPRHTLDPAELSARLRLFGAVALLAIPVLFLAGIWLAWRLAGGVEAIAGSAYGQLLLGKLAAGSVALALGALNKQIVGRLVESEPARGRRLLRATLGLDSALFLTALSLVVLATTITGPME